MHSDALADSVVSLLKLSDVKDATTFDAVSFGSQVDPKVAQTVVILGGADGTGVTKTTLTKFHYTKSESTTTPSTLASIDTTPKIPDDYHGALVVNLDGQAVGITIAATESARAFIYPASRILKLINAVSADATHSGSAKGTSATTVQPQS